MAPAKGRSAARQAEVQCMDSIERAMAKIEDLTPQAQARVRQWITDEYVAHYQAETPKSPEEPAP